MSNLEKPPYQMPDYDLVHWLENHEHHKGHGCAICEAIEEIRWSRKHLSTLEKAVEEAVEKLRGIEGWQAREIRTAFLKVVGVE